MSLLGYKKTIIFRLLSYRYGYTLKECNDWEGVLPFVSNYFHTKLSVQRPKREGLTDRDRQSNGVTFAFIIVVKWTHEHKKCIYVYK